jgi:penicillin-binding protein 1A
MDSILIKMLATFLALAQVTTRPDAVKTHFDAGRDQAAVTRILRDGCGHMRKAFDVENLDLDDLIKTAMDDPDALSEEIKAMHGLKFDSLLAVYRQFCKSEDVKDSPVDLGQVITFYDDAVADLPDHTRLKNARTAVAGGVLDGRGERFADLSESDRRIWVPLKDIPLNVQKAFIAAEDKRFYEHKGIDERGLIRAMVSNLASSGRPQGGSTVTQQVVKNLLVGDDVTYERKLREIILASRLERTLSKSEILELYLNSIFLGRSSWGIELAARNYFGKPASALTLHEGAMLAAMPKGPTYYNPDRHPDRARERLAYVLGRMQEDSDAATAPPDTSTVALPQMVAHVRTQQRDSGYYFLDYVTREARTFAGIGALTTGATTVRTTIRPDLQRATEVALQEGLTQYEMRNQRVEWHGAEVNLADEVKRIQAETAATAQAARSAPDTKPTSAALTPGPARNGRFAKSPAGTTGLTPGPQSAVLAPPAVKAKPAWRQALEAAHLPLYDVHWPAAIVLSNGGGRNGGGVQVGLADGRIMQLASASLAGRNGLNLYDVVFVKVTDAGNGPARAELRVRPTVQGAAIVLDNSTGAILAMTGGFSYSLSQFNRAAQMQRQPGSTLKPFTYLAALHNGLQPNTLVRDTPLTLPPINNTSNARKDYWTPKNYEGGGESIMTLRHGLENSVNLVTANLLKGGIASDPRESLSRVCELALDAQVYHECAAYYPFILGAQPARLIDMAAFYAAIATEGRRPQPYGVEAIELNGRTVYTHKSEAKWLASGDRPAFFQLRTMLQGVVVRGTARAIGHLSGYVGGKTGTSEDENDAWFIGFDNDVTVAIWVGYDNADGQRRTLGDSQTGGQVAVPIFEPVIEATWANYARKTPLKPPSAAAAKELAPLPIDLNSGNRLAQRQPQAFTEYFRLKNGQFADTQYLLVSANERVAARDPGDAQTYASGAVESYGKGTYSPPGAGYYQNNGYSSGGYYHNGQGGYQGGYYPNGQGGYYSNGQGGYYQGGYYQSGQSGYYQAGQGNSNGRRVFQGGYDQYGSVGDSRYPEDRRWAPPRLVDPDVPWRQRQGGYW